MPSPVDAIPGAAIRSKYPWADWLVPGTWKFIKGEDFAIQAASFLTACSREMKERGIDGQVAVRNGDVYVIIPR